MKCDDDFLTRELPGLPAAPRRRAPSLVARGYMRGVDRDRCGTCTHRKSGQGAHRAVERTMACALSDEVVDEFGVCDQYQQ